MRTLSTLYLVAQAVIPPVYGRLVRHDASFQPDHILRVAAENYSQACSERYSVLVNGSLPGPELRLQEGEVSWIRVYNDMEDSNVTMHWHGLSAFTAPFSDGTPMASQWPIPPGHFFDYEVLPEVGYAGTYFYHSHVGFQAVTAAGALIVESTEQPPYNDPSALLVNGQGRSANDTDGSCKLAALEVEASKTYRLRFIGATALSTLSLSIEDHDVLEIIEADGHYTKSAETGFVQIASGQRYSVLLKTKTEDELQAAGSRQFYFQINTVGGPPALTTYAILQYPSEEEPDLTTIPADPPLPLATLTNGWLDYTLQPYGADPNFPTADEVTRRIVVTVHSNASDHIVYLQNGYDWVETFPGSPYLVDIYNGELDLDSTYERAVDSGNAFDNQTRLFPAKMGEVLEIVWQNQGGVDVGDVQHHPFHGHGRHFYDIGGGPGLYDPTKNEERLKETSPVQRDTTILYGYQDKTSPLEPSGWRAWRVRVEAAGVWMMHCHILHHMVMGMQTVFVFGNEEDIKEQAGPVADGYLTYGGSAYGNSKRSPEVRHYF
ncbi:hypothetical protein LMH87_010647 [Akanthomyces muscarius]|uniref:L-ascorbate oxidase n=1 Tax=Akanthomyces muscarius TaxID=2231603 RepID=A0A9W8UJZ1_AKAMU|nr:hypothetical protein LMH87_010647 [Akanthomyces muscarius]KAJ4149869.1 hypothetical protein LMH87_010647 [Akanthomyces muscarius]